MNEKNNHTKTSDYIQGKLNQEESQRLEESMSASDFDSDALDGLLQMKNKQELDSIIFDLNHTLKKELKKRKRKQFKGTDPTFIALVALITILITVFIAFYIYHLHFTG